MDDTLIIHNVNKWLLDNFPKLEESVKATTCNKWKKWLCSNEKPFPCVCPFRDKACVFIEAYYKIEQARKFRSQEITYLTALDSFSKLEKTKKYSSYMWINAYKKLGEELVNFDPSMEIRVEKEPYKVWEIRLSLDQFPNLLKFKKIFAEYYNSEKNENY